MSFKKRLGSTIREHNIEIVMDKLKKGMTDSDILTELAMCFCSDTRIDYLNTAKEKLKMESSQPKEKQPQQEEIASSNNTESESLVEYAKKHPHLTNTCKNCGKSVPENTTFCSKECVEKYKTEHGKQ